MRVSALRLKGHHPEIAFGWGYAEINFTTHATQSLHKNDFVMAELVDKLA
ncbi:MAG: 4a-hydroxytetrahydrobiopterin dehydratase [Rickettsiales bacterium]